MREVGQAPHDYRCDTCPASERANRRCGRDGDGDLKASRWLLEARRTGKVKPADPLAPDACALLRLETTPRAGEALQGVAHWRDHAEGPRGRGRSPQPLWWLSAQDEIQAETAAIERERDEARRADDAARRAGLQVRGRG